MWGKWIGIGCSSSTYNGWFSREDFETGKFKAMIVGGDWDDLEVLMHQTRGGCKPIAFLSRILHKLSFRIKVYKLFVLLTSLQPGLSLTPLTILHPALTRNIGQTRNFATFFFGKRIYMQHEAFPCFRPHFPSSLFLSTLPIKCATLCLCLYCPNYHPPEWASILSNLKVEVITSVYKKSLTSYVFGGCQVSPEPSSFMDQASVLGGRGLCEWVEGRV